MTASGTLKERLAAGGYNSQALVGANQGGDEIVKSRAGADFEVRMCRSASDFAVRKQLPREPFSQNEQFNGLAEGHFAVIQSDVLLAPGHLQFGFNGLERNFLGKFLKAFFVELYAVVIVANQEFV